MLPLHSSEIVDPQMPAERFSRRHAREFDEETSPPRQTEPEGRKSGGNSRVSRPSHQSTKTLICQSLSVAERAVFELRHTERCLLMSEIQTWPSAKSISQKCHEQTTRLLGDFDLWRLPGTVEDCFLAPIGADVKRERPFRRWQPIAFLVGTRRFGSGIYGQ